MPVERLGESLALHQLDGADGPRGRHVRGRRRGPVSDRRDARATSPSRRSARRPSRSWRGPPTAACRRLSADVACRGGSRGRRAGRLGTGCAAGASSYGVAIQRGRPRHARSPWPGGRRGVREMYRGALSWGGERARTQPLAVRPAAGAGRRTRRRLGRDGPRPLVPRHPEAAGGAAGALRAVAGRSSLAIQLVLFVVWLGRRGGRERARPASGSSSSCRGRCSSGCGCSSDWCSR